MPNTIHRPSRVSAIVSALRARGPLHTHNLQLARRLLTQPGGEEDLLEAFVTYIVESTRSKVPLLPSPTDSEVLHVTSTYLGILLEYSNYPLLAQVGVRSLSSSCARRWQMDCKELEATPLEFALPREEEELNRRLSLAAQEMVIELGRQLGWPATELHQRLSAFLSEPGNTLVITAAQVEHWQSRAARIAHEALTDPEKVIRARQAATPGG